jgi:hypothetical protein
MSFGDFIKNPTQTILKHTVNELDNKTDGEQNKGVMSALFSNPSLLRISTKDSKQQIYQKEYDVISYQPTSGIKIFSFIIGIIAACLSWYNNSLLGYSMIEKIFFSIFSFFFGIIYLFYYFIVRYNESRILNKLN